MSFKQTCKIQIHVCMCACVVCVNCYTVDITASFKLHLSTLSLTKTSWPKCIHTSALDNEDIQQSTAVPSCDPTSIAVMTTAAGSSVTSAHTYQTAQHLTPEHSRSSSQPPLYGLQILDLPHCRDWQLIPPTVSFAGLNTWFHKTSVGLYINSISKQNIHCMLQYPVLL